MSAEVASDNAQRLDSRCEVLDQVDQLRKIEGLREDGGYAHLQHRLRLDSQMRRHHDDRNAAQVTSFLETLEKVPAVDFRHREVEQDDVRMMDVESALPFLAVAGQQDLKAVLAQRRRQHSAQRQIV